MKEARLMLWVTGLSVLELGECDDSPNVWLSCDTVLRSAVKGALLESLSHSSGNLGDIPYQV